MNERREYPYDLKYFPFLKVPNTILLIPIRIRVKVVNLSFRGSSFRRKYVFIYIKYRDHYKLTLYRISVDIWRKIVNFNYFFVINLLKLKRIIKNLKNYIIYIHIHIQIHILYTCIHIYICIYYTLHKYWQFFELINFLKFFNFNIFLKIKHKILNIAQRKRLKIVKSANDFKMIYLFITFMNIWLRYRWYFCSFVHFLMWVIFQEMFSKMYENKRNESDIYELVFVIAP